MSDLTPENQKRAVNDAINIVKSQKPDMLTEPGKIEQERIMEKVEVIIRNVRTMINPIVEAQKDSGVPMDIRHKFLLATLHKFYVEELNQFSRDELLYLCALVHAHVMKETLI